MMEAFKQWRVYFEGAVVPVKVWTDHKNLEYFSTAKTISRRHAQWAATLASYNYVISFRRGVSNGKADALSRNPSFVPPPPPFPAYYVPCSGPVPATPTKPASSSNHVVARRPPPPHHCSSSGQ